MANFDMEKFVISGIDGNTYTLKTDTSLTKSGVPADAKEVGDNLDEYGEQLDSTNEELEQLESNFTDMQSDGFVPSAEQILTDKGVTDSVPYHYRKTSGDGADRLYDQIVGGTVCWNQLADLNSPLTQTWAEDTSTYYGNMGLTNRPFDLISGHKYAVCFDVERTISSNDAVGVTFGAANSGVLVTYDDGESNGKKWSIRTCSNTYLSTVGISYSNYNGKKGFSSGDYITVKSTMLFDLTAMFGSTIADYIYNLEQTTAGAGVAFFKALFPNDYYPYDAGTLKSVEGLSEHKTVGFNQWDGSYTAKAWIENPSTGKIVNGINGYNVTDYIRVLPNTIYYTTGSGSSRGTFFDKDKNPIAQCGTTSAGVFTSPSNAYYVRTTIVNEKLATFCFNVSDPAKNGQYKPYKAHSYPLDNTLTLRGLFKLDANNNFYADGDTYDADGTVTRRYGVHTFDGTESLTKLNTGTEGWYEYAYAPTQSTPNGSSINFVTDYGEATASFDTNNITKVVVRHFGTGFRWSMNVDSTASALSALNGKTLVYELATPTTETADPYQHLQQCDPNGTEEYVSAGIVPIGHNSFYPENLRAKIEQLPWNFASLIAPTESAFVATRNYVTGDLFIVQNVLYKATSNIANGGSITPNTNCTATTLAEIISALA